MGDRFAPKECSSCSRIAPANEMRKVRWKEIRRTDFHRRTDSGYFVPSGKAERRVDRVSYYCTECAEERDALVSLGWKAALCALPLVFLLQFCSHRTKAPARPSFSEATAAESVSEERSQSTETVEAPAIQTSQTVPQYEPVSTTETASEPQATSSAAAERDSEPNSAAPQIDETQPEELEPVNTSF